MIGSAKIPITFSAPATVENQWCPGCGNFPILQTVQKVLQAQHVEPRDVTFVSGIGQAAKLPHYLACNYFNGLHGRALPAATGIKLANPTQTVIVTSGDGDMYGEGGNHLIHAIRRNPDITVIVHNNMTYGLTKGQASPTSEEGMVTPTQPLGVITDPLNPVALAIALDAPFVARASAGDQAQLFDILTQAIAHKGFALVDVLQPCVVFNKINTYAWFAEHAYTVDADADRSNQAEAFRRATDVGDRYPLGVLYQHDRRATYEDAIGVYRADARPLYQRTTNCAIRSALVAAQI